MDSELIKEELNKFLKENLLVILVGGVGLILLVGGLIMFFGDNKTEIVLEEGSYGEETEGIIADIEGAVIKPGVYKLSSDSRVHDLLILAGGLTSDADREYIQKRINLAQKLTDGVKIYFPRTSEISDGSVSVLGAEERLININSASSLELESLPGIGKVTAQKIIESRPYGSLEELVEKKAVGSSVFEKIKEKITIY